MARRICPARTGLRHQRRLDAQLLSQPAGRGLSAGSGKLTRRLGESPDAVPAHRRARSRRRAVSHHQHHTEHHELRQRQAARAQRREHDSHAVVLRVERHRIPAHLDLPARRAHLVDRLLRLGRSGGPGYVCNQIARREFPHDAAERPPWHLGGQSTARATAAALAGLVSPHDARNAGHRPRRERRAHPSRRRRALRKSRPV